MALELEQQIAHLRYGDHLCLIYEDTADQMRAMVPFVTAGLARGERCVYIADDRTAEEVLEALARARVDIPRERDRGALAVLSKRDAYLRSGVFDPFTMIDFLLQAHRETLAAGFKGLRVTGEMTWALGPEPGTERLMEYEAMLNRVFPGSRMLAICQYNRRRFSPEIIRDVLRTHPLAIIGDQVCPNPYYEPPDVALGDAPEAKRVDWMITQVRRARAVQEALEEAIDVREALLSITAAAMRGPLATIQATTRRLEDAVAGEPGPERAEMAEAIREIASATARMLAYMDDLREVSRLQQGRMDFRPEHTDLAEVARRVVARFEHAPERTARHTLVLDAPGPAYGTWDPDRLEDVVANLVSNALKFSPDGGEVRVTVRPIPHGAELSVSDQGIGIPEEEQAAIFQPFIRGEAGAGGGRGLGLYLASQIVERHGGTISVRSAPGKGSTFTVQLPLVPPAPMNVPDAFAQAHGGGMPPVGRRRT